MDSITRNPAPDVKPESKRALWLGVLLPGILLLVFVALPFSPLEKARFVGYGVCHQLPEHSYQPGGVPLPLCARCSGMFLAALLGMAMVWLMGRGRCAKLPPPRVLVVLVLFFLVWAADGLNSFLSSYPGMPYLYAPSNLLRLITGTLNGLTLGLIIQPLINMILWQEPDPRPTIPGLASLAAILGAGVGLVALIAAEWRVTLYPLALLSGLSVLAVLGILNGLIIVLATRRENTLTPTLRGVLPYALWGLVFSLLELSSIALFRAWLTHLLGVPL